MQILLPNRASDYSYFSPARDTRKIAGSAGAVGQARVVASYIGSLKEPRRSALPASNVRQTLAEQPPAGITSGASNGRPMLKRWGSSAHSVSLLMWCQPG